MECAVCLGDGANFTLNGCGHHFHHDCLKQWYISKKSETTCPLCRSAFEIKSWSNEKKSSDAHFGELFDSYLEAFESSQYKQYKHHKMFCKAFMLELGDIQFTMNYFGEYMDEEDLEEYLDDYGPLRSDKRHVDTDFVEGFVNDSLIRDVRVQVVHPCVYAS